MATCKSWPLERFAKCVSPSTSNSNQSHKIPGNWKQVCSDSSSNLQISLLDSNHLLISSYSGTGSQIHESFTLFDASKWLRAAVKGDSVLFIYKIKDETRRFRIKFTKAGSSSSLDQCRDFISKMSPYFPVREVPAAESDSQIPMDDAQVINYSQTSNSSSDTTASPGVVGSANQEQVTMSVLSKNVCNLHVASHDLPRAGETTNLPTSQLNLLVRLCLTDANFPAFVDAVEKELLDIQMS